jgi:hypothetical protein
VLRFVFGAIGVVNDNVASSASSGGNKNETLIHNMISNRGANWVAHQYRFALALHQPA